MKELKIIKQQKSHVVSGREWVSEWLDGWWIRHSLVRSNGREREAGITGSASLGEISKSQV